MLLFIGITSGFLLASCNLIDDQLTKPGKPIPGSGKDTIPKDSIIIPKDTIIVPIDTVIVPIDTIIIPIDTIIVPIDTIPGDTIRRHKTKR